MPVASGRRGCAGRAARHPAAQCSTETVEHILYTRCRSSAGTRQQQPPPRGIVAGPGHRVPRPSRHPNMREGHDAGLAWRRAPGSGECGRGRALVGVILAGRPGRVRRIPGGVRGNRPAGRVFPARRLVAVYRRAVLHGQRRHARAPVARAGVARRGRWCPDRGAGRILARQTRRAGGPCPPPPTRARPRNRWLHRGVARADQLLARYGHARAIVLARFIPVVRTVLNPLAGMLDVPARTFTLWQVIGGVVWAAGITLAGYLLGASVPGIDQYLLPVIAIILI